LASSGPLLPDHLPDPLVEQVRAQDPTPKTWEDDLDPVVQNFLLGNRESGKGRLHDLLIERVEKLLFQHLLEKNRGNQVATARDLGINRNTLKRKIDAMNIEPKKKKSQSSF
ncbi:MAG: sigma-54-dependent Fis family transcriptional regulator, partial [Nitrospinaceae bacterium]|nr:sigma-54-dependent Fis family transcriptional regulator [Nitrospinaceae bacterium]NIR54259.1 sigma-54-dependent Fis family transcriptional regulator [Nitrospinaceae bacterium]NIS84676.1 sigma-54-dependent Fis family transcriptional regulator [Nitrospinaceae bacterium]NIT81471.1 sigma-54-dependent Fis family transcriptional regulator [Nitrospinaceae bacterium]NIU43755.1 sigma-54-dependent Fis family transcriptional regulator [Nitrospinaceae bacterium]